VREHTAYILDDLLNSADFGVAKPDPMAGAGALRRNAAAHGAIEADVGRPLPRSDVWFTDDRDDNVAAAREFGWDAELFVLSGRR
jgi:putative hydrolase of the HAD superfamily